jgi:hypothetical protein
MRDHSSERDAGVEREWMLMNDPAAELRCAAT